MVDVDYILTIIHEYFPRWETPEELCLDAETVHQIASAIKLQGEWVKQRSTSLYTDPFLIEEKLRKLSREEICEIFLGSWHPIVEFEQISPRSLAEAIEYWQNLVPLEGRWQEINASHLETGMATREELLRQQIMAEKEFAEELETFWQELKQKAMGDKKIDYWDFIGAETYEETVNRAYLASFLVTYGYATVEVDRLEEMVYIKPYKTPVPTVSNKQAVSLPIAISVEDWKSWKEGETD